MYILLSVLRFFAAIALDPIDWVAIGFVFFLLGGLLLAFFLYFRTAFKEGGWKNVRYAARIALVVLLLFFIARILKNREISSLKEFINSLFG
jgi:hypothetical protein